MAVTEVTETEADVGFDVAVEMGPDASMTDAAVTVLAEASRSAPDRTPGAGGRATGERRRRRGAKRGYDGLTVRTVARRAGVAPATAYTYFASKDHLLAEVLWRRLQALPVPSVHDHGR